jgi:hypothetical protein
VAVNNEDYAIVVGINAYPRLRILRGALSDAGRFAEWLMLPEGGGLPERNVHVISGPEAVPTNLREARPVQEDIDEVLTRIGVERNVRIGRRLYFYFAGHGFGPSFNDIGMLMAHAATRLLKRNIGLGPYRRYFHDHALFDELVFIVDCCRDRTRGIETTGPDFTNMPDGPLGQVLDFTMMAAAYGEKAFEPTNGPGAEPRGLLTRAVLEGLQDPAATDASGRFTSRSLEVYVKRRVPELAEDAKMRQEPEVDPPQNEIVFGTAPTQMITVRILAPAGLAGDLVLRDANMDELERRPAAEATKERTPWQVPVASNRWYAVQRTADPPSSPPDILVPNRLKGPDNVFKVKRSP